MTDLQSTTDQQILDFRMEYPLLASAVFALRNMYWLGYGAFFAVNTLLATAFGFSHSDHSNFLAGAFLKTSHLFIPIIGIFIPASAIYAAEKIRKSERTVIVRGIQIDETLHTRVFSSFANQSQRFPWMTAIGSLLFLVIWAGALYSAAF